MKSDSVDLPFDEESELQNVITKDCTSEYEPVNKLDFSKFIRKKIKEYNEVYNKELTPQKLAIIVGFNSYDVFKQTLNRRKTTNKRDCIIAICISLQLLKGGINHALYLYDMPSLNQEDPRDKVIIKYIKDSIGKDAPDLSISRLNQCLKENGKRELDIHNNRGSNRRNKDKRKEASSPYKVLKLLVHMPFDEEYYYEDPCKSLCTKFLPGRCDCTGSMYLYECDRKEYYKLSANSNGPLYSQKYYKDKAPDPRHNYDSLDSTGCFKESFRQLLDAIDTERHRLLDILNDTKNYSIRVSARVINDSLCVFVEEYNYKIPESNEYYVLTLSDSKYALCVYEQSAFMYYYLSPNDYEATYAVPFGNPKERYDSLEQIDLLMENTDKRTNEYLKLHFRKEEFLKLLPIVDELLQKLKNHEAYIRNPKSCDDDVELLEHYQLETDFEHVYKRDGDREIHNTLSEKEYFMSDGQSVIITLDDLYEAYSLGLKDIDEICRIKQKYKAISNLIR